MKVFAIAMVLASLLVFIQAKPRRYTGTSEEERAKDVLQKLLTYYVMASAGVNKVFD